VGGVKWVVWWRDWKSEAVEWSFAPDEVLFTRWNIFEYL